MSEKFVANCDTDVCSSRCAPAIGDDWSSMVTLLTLAFLGFFAILMLGWPRTATAFALATTVLWPSYIVLSGIPGPGINPQRIMIPICVIIWALHMTAGHAYRRHLTAIISANSATFLMIVAFFLLGVVSGMLSPFDKIQAVWGSLNQILFIPVLLLLILSYFRTPGSIFRLLALIVGISLVVQILGAVEWVRQEVVFNEFVVPGSEHAEKILEGKLRLDRHRVTSVFDNPLSYAQFLVFVAPLIIFQLKRGANQIWKMLGSFQLIAIPLSVWSTGSRAGMALIILTYLWVFFLWLRPLKLTIELRALVLTGVFGLVASMVTIVLLRLGVSGLLGGSQSIEASTMARLYQLAVGVPAIAQSPIYGFGVHQGTNFLGGLTSIDNYYLTVALEKGIVGLVLLLGIQASVLLKLFRSSRSSENGDIRTLAELLFIGFAVFFIFESTLSVVEVFSVTFPILACFWLLEHFEHSQQNH